MPNYPFSLASQESYFTPSITETHLILEKLAFNEHKAELWVSTIHAQMETRNVEQWQLFLNVYCWNKTQENHIDTCSMRWRTARDFLKQPLGDRRLLDHQVNLWSRLKQRTKGRCCERKAFKDARDRKCCRYVMVEAVFRRIVAALQRRWMWSAIQYDCLWV